MTSIHETVTLLNLVGEPTRVRLLALLAREELTVAELTAVTELSQSRVSTHLGRLKDAGLLRDRRVGASTFYAARNGGMPAGAQRLWSLVEGSLSDAVLEADWRRASEMVRARGDATAWPDTVAGQMDRHYSPGRTWEATARGLLGLVELGRVLDVGAGDGVMAELLAPYASNVTCVDRSERVIEAARTRLARFANIEYVVADMHDLPFAEDTFDQVLMFNVLTYARDPARALAEVGRVARPDAVFALVTLEHHEHADVTSAYGHLQSGFAPSELVEMMNGAGFEVRRCEVTSRERRRPYFQVVTAHGTKRRTRQ